MLQQVLERFSHLDDDVKVPVPLGLLREMEREHAKQKPKASADDGRSGA